MKFQSSCLQPGVLVLACVLLGWLLQPLRGVGVELSDSDIMHFSITETRKFDLSWQNFCWGVDPSR